MVLIGVERPAVSKEQVNEPKLTLDSQAHCAGSDAPWPEQGGPVA